MKKEFYPNREYNSKRRTKYFVLFAVLVAIFALMDTWMISEKFYIGLFLNAFIIPFLTFPSARIRICCTIWNEFKVCSRVFC